MCKLRCRYRHQSEHTPARTCAENQQASAQKAVHYTVPDFFARAGHLYTGDAPEQHPAQ
ncbi:hypothetical protein HAX39_24520 [Citrobacter freundii]|nr:hypothetical protein [Citrobacter freundii]